MLRLAACTSVFGSPSPRMPPLPVPVSATVPVVPRLSVPTCMAASLVKLKARPSGSSRLVSAVPVTLSVAVNSE